MKKIIAFLILLLCLKQSYAQYPLKQYLGSDSTLVTVRGGMNARLVLWSFTDTTQANTQRISQYAGALIYTTVLDKVWYRNSTATGWIEFTSSGGTTTNIYNSDGFITGTRVLDLSASPLTFSRSGVKQFAAEDNLTTIGSPNNQKRITVYNDSITILGLSQTTDTTTYKPLAIDGNGYFTIMDRWPGSGSKFGLEDILATSARYFNAASYKFAVKNIPTNGFSGLFSGDSSDINNSSAGGYYSFTQSELPATILGVRSSYGSGINSYISVNKNSEAEIDLSTNYISSSRIIINPYAGITITPADSILKITSLQSGTITDSVILWRSSDKSVRKITLAALSSGLSGWSLSGNAVSSLGTDYLGSTNGNPILFKLGSISSGIINGSGADPNTSFGYGANNTDSNSNAGTYNSAFGYNSLAENTGSFNSAFGTSSLSVNTSGSQNAAFGTNSLLSNTTGQKNTSVGAGSLENNTSGDDNTAIGQDALLANTTGIRNIGIGWNGFANNFTGGQNVGIGYGAGKTITNGNNNTILGAFAAWDAAQNDTITGAVIIGHSATASEDSTVVLGNDYIKKTHLKGVVYAPFTAGSATTSDSALVVDRSTGALIMRPVSGSSSYTFTNGLTNSSGTVKLGGTLTETTTINTNTNELAIQSNSSGDRGTIFFNGAGQVEFSASSNVDNSTIRVVIDSLQFEPKAGRMNIDTLAAASNMTNKRVMTWDTVTKRWEQIAKDSVGGSGGSPGGSTKQIQYNNAGSFGGAAGFEYQAAASPNVLIKGQDKSYIPLIVKGIDSSQTSDLFRVSRYNDSAMIRVAANGSVTIGPAYDGVNFINPPGHEFRYVNAGYTGGIKISNVSSGSVVRLHTLGNGLYMTDNAGTASPLVLGTWANPGDGSTFTAANQTWTISAGRFGVGGAATSTVHSQGSFATAYTATATGITLGITHSIVNVTATGQTITLPTAASITGRQYTIKLTASGSCTVDGNASETIDGAATYSLASQYKYVTIVSDGANWIVTANN